MHGLLWLYDLPSTYRLYDELIGIARPRGGPGDQALSVDHLKYREIIGRWADSISSTQIPLSIRHLPCPFCKKNLEGGGTPIRDKGDFDAFVYKSIPPSHSAPSILECTLCNKDISPQNLLLFAIKNGIEKYFDGTHCI